MRIFILEDDHARILTLRERLFNHNLTIINSCIEVDKFQPPYDLLLLDHDLGGRQLEGHEDCGLTFVRLVKPRLSSVVPIIIHSYNPVGAADMMNELEGFHVAWAPFMGSTFKAALNLCAGL